jgi:hypothetical protein
MTDTSTSTGVDVSEEKKPSFRNEAPKDAAIAVDAAKRSPVAGKTYSRYSHLFAIHSKSKPSPLTRQDQTETPNFDGFRNLMALVLSIYQLAACHNSKLTAI